MSERFRRSWNGRIIKSSQGYSVRIAGRTRIEYGDGQISLAIDCEVMAHPSREIVVYRNRLALPSRAVRALERVEGAPVQ